MRLFLHNPRLKMQAIEALESSNEERVLIPVAVPSQTRHPRSVLQ